MRCPPYPETDTVLATTEGGRWTPARAPRGVVRLTNRTFRATVFTCEEEM
jgi:hypothetical protein